MAHPWLVVRRALQLRCVACGARPILLNWFREVPCCPRCGFRLDRNEPGYWLGSYTVNLSVTLVVVTLLLVVLIWWQWPAPRWTAITLIGIVTSVVLPLAIFPWTKTLYLALDVIFRPPEEADFIGPAEPAMKRRQ